MPPNLHDDVPAILTLEVAEATAALAGVLDEAGIKLSQFRLNSGPAPDDWLVRLGDCNVGAGLALANLLRDGMTLRAKYPGESVNADSSGEYTTFAPKDELCRTCRKPFGSLERVRRVRPSGLPSGRPYVHLECGGTEPRDQWWTEYGGTLDQVSGVISFPRGALPRCPFPCAQLSPRPQP